MSNMNNYQKHFESYMREHFNGEKDLSKDASLRYKNVEVAQHFSTWMNAYSVAKEESAEQIKDNLLS